LLFNSECQKVQKYEKHQENLLENPKNVQNEETEKKYFWFWIPIKYLNISIVWSRQVQHISAHFT